MSSSILRIRGARPKPRAPALALLSIPHRHRTAVPDGDDEVQQPHSS